MRQDIETGQHVPEPPADITAGRPGFSLDLWGDLDAEEALLRQEAAAALPERGRGAALLLYEIGRLTLARGAEAEAAQLLLQSYTQRPQFRPTIRLARQLYRERGDLKLVIKLLEAEARATRDPMLRAALLRYEGRLQWLRVGELDVAAERLADAQRMDPSDLATLILADLLDAVRQMPEQRRTHIARQLDIVDDPTLEAALQLDRALLADPASSSDAMDTLEQARKEHPDALSLLVLSEIFAEQTHDDAQLVDVLVAQATLPDADAAWRSRVLHRAAAVCAEELDDPKRGAALLAQAVSLQPGYGATADQFELLLELDDNEGALAAGRRLFEMETHDAVRAALACRLGDLCRVQLADDDRAADWYRRCLRAAPGYQRALELLASYLEAAGRIEELLAAQEAEAARARTPEARAHHLVRIGALLERHDRAVEAITAYGRALAEHPTCVPAAAALERLLTRHERWRELVALYEQQLERERDAERALLLLECSAAILDHQLQDVDRALACYRRIIERQPDYLPALRASARLCAQAQRWHELVSQTRSEVELTVDPQRRAELLHHAGEVWENRLLDLDLALEHYRRALQDNPGYLPALRSLGRLYRQRGQWRPLIEMHRAEIEISSDAEHIVGLLFAIAKIYEDELIDEQSAAETYREILARQPEELPAIAALARSLEARGRWQELAELLESTLDAVGDARSKAEQLWRVGMIREARLDDRAGAVAVYTRALRLAADLTPARAALARLLERDEKHAELLELLALAVERTADDHERSALSLRMAELVERSQGDIRTALAQIERALDGGAQPSSATLATLARLYRQLAQPRELCDTLETLSKRTSSEPITAQLELRVARVMQHSGIDDPLPHYRAVHEKRLAGSAYALRATERYLRDGGAHEAVGPILHHHLEQSSDRLERGALLAELGDIQRAAGDMQRAERAYRNAIEHDSGQLVALWRLGELLEDQERWRERAELAELQIAALGSAPQLADTLVVCGGIWQDRLGEPDRAVPFYQRAMAAIPTHPIAFERLHLLFSERGAWSQLAALLHTQISALSDDRQLAQRYGELGQLYLDRLDQPRKAEACLRRVLEIDPYDVYALTTLGDLCYRRSDWRSAEQLYGRAELVIEQPGDRVPVQRLLGELFLTLEQPREALDAFARARRDAGRVDPWLLRNIAKAARLAGDVDAHNEALERLAELVEDPDEQVRLLKQVARIAEERLDDDERAVRALQQGLVLDPLDLEAIEKLAAIYGRRGDRDAAAQHLQAAVAHHRAQLARTPINPQLYRQLGRIFRWQKRFDRLYCSCVALTQIQAIGDIEQRFMFEHHRNCAAAPTRGLAPGRLMQLVVPAKLAGPLDDFLERCSGPLRRFLASSPAQLGLSRADRAPAGHPLWQQLGAMVQLFGGGADIELWVSPHDDDVVAPVHLGKPALLVGHGVASREPTAGDRFRIGRALLLLHKGGLLLQDRSVRVLRALFSALGRAALPSVELSFAEADPAEVQRQMALASKRLGRRERRELATLFDALGDSIAAIDLAAHARALACAGNRAGLAVAGDPLSGLRNAHPVVTTAGEELGDLLQFLVSEEYFTLRDELGISPG